MEFIQGQVVNMDRAEKNIRKTKEQKQAEYRRQKDYELLMRTCAEIDTLKSRLSQLSDSESIEASIYRLKAAELELNHHIRSVRGVSSKDQKERLS